MELLTPDQRENSVIVPSGVLADFRPHPITTDGRCTIICQPGSTLAEAMRLHLPHGAPAVATVNGVTYGRSAWDKIILKDGDIISVRTTVDGGGGGSNPIAVVLSLAVLIAAPFLATAILATGPVTGAAVSATLATVSGQLLTAGIGLAGILIINSLFPPRLPNLSTGRGAGQPPPQYSISGGANQARPYEPLILVLGSHRVFPDLAAQEYTEFDEDGDQFLNQIFDFGLGNLSISDISIGETDISNFDAVETESEVSSVTLVSGNIDTIQGGELTYNEPLVRQTAGRTVKISYDIISQDFRAENDGSLRGRSVDFALEYRLTGANDWQRQGVTITTPSGADARNPVRRSFTYEVPEGAYDVRAILLSEIDEDDERLTSRHSIAAFRAHQESVADYTGRNPFAMRIKATGQLYGRLQSVNANVSQLIDRWNGEVWVENQATSNPADILLKYYRGWRINGRLVAGMGLSDNRIDFDSIQRFADHCIANDLHCDLVLTSKQEHTETLRTICQCGWGSVDLQSGKWGALWENAGQPMSAIITPSNVIAGSVAVTYDNENLADEIIGNFIDIQSDYQSNQVRRNVPEVQNPERPAEVDLDGIVRGEQAAKEMNRAVAAQAFHIRTISWEMDIDEGMGISRGDVVGASHGLIGSGIGGRFVSIDSSRQVITTSRTDLGSDSSSSGFMWIWLLDEQVVSVKYDVEDDGSIRLFDSNQTDQAFSLPDPFIPSNVQEDPTAYRFMAFRVDDESEDRSINAVEPIRLRITGKEPSGSDRLRFVARDEVDEYYAHRTSDLSWTPLSEVIASHIIQVSGFSVNQTDNGVRVFSWTPHENPDVVGYRIRYAPEMQGGGFDTMTDLHQGLLTASPFESGDRPSEGSWRFAIVAVLSDGRRTVPTFARSVIKPGLRIADAIWLFGDVDPANDLGENGNLYLNRSSNVVFRKENNSWVQVTDLSGADGAQWLVGQGVPNDELGRNGDYYFNRNVAHIYQKQNGTWVFLIDIDGEDGSVWFSGQGIPLEQTGNVGDYYLQTTNGFVYRKTAATIWAFQQDITGPQGIQGARGEDGNGVEHIFTITPSTDTPPLPSNDWGFDEPESPWADGAPNTTPQSPFLWRCERRVLGTPQVGDSVPFTWNPPFIISHYGLNGIDGQDGNGVEYVFRLTSTATRPANPSNDWGYDQPAAPWTDGGQSVTSSNPYLWRSERRVPGTPAVGTAISSSWSTPKVIGRFGPTGATGARGRDGLDGDDGQGIEFIYIRTVNDETTPTAPLNIWGFDQPEEGWTDAAPNLSSSLPVLWRSQRTIVGAPSVGDPVVASWTTPVIHSRYGDDGEKGDKGDPGDPVSRAMLYDQLSATIVDGGTVETIGNTRSSVTGARIVDLPPGPNGELRGELRIVVTRIINHESGSGDGGE